MARLSDTSIVNTNGQSGDVFCGWNIEIDVVQYDAPFIVRLLRLQYKHSICAALCNVCYNACMDNYGNRMPVVLEYEAALNYGKCRDDRFPRQCDFYYNSIEVHPVYVLRYKQDFFHKILNGTGARFGFDLMLKDSTNVPYVHKHPGGYIYRYDFCANTVSRDLVTRYVEDEYIPYVTSCKYKLGIEETLDGKFLFRLTPIKRFELTNE